MEIIEAISDTNIGGAGVLLVTRLSENRKMGAKTLVVLPKESALADRLRSIGVSVKEIDRCADRSFQLSAIPEYVRIIKKECPHTVNCHGCLSFRIAAFLCRVPVRVYTRHCTFPQKRWQRSHILRQISGLVQCMLSNGIIAVAQAAKNDLVSLGIPEDRICVIVNGVSGLKKLDASQRSNIRKRMSLSDRDVVVGIFARLEEYKGHTDFLEAASILLEKSDIYRFLIVGDGSRREALEKICQEKGIGTEVVFTGFVDDVTEYMNITDINVNCSCGTETSSLALSEGMSIGIPAVVSDFGGNTYMVRNGENGLVFSVNDARLLAELIEKIATDSVLREMLSQNAYKRFVDELNAKKMTEATYNYYTGLRSLKDFSAKKS